MSLSSFSLPEKSSSRLYSRLLIAPDTSCRVSRSAIFSAESEPLLMLMSESVAIDSMTLRVFSCEASSPSLSFFCCAEMATTSLSYSSRAALILARISAMLFLRFSILLLSASAADARSSIAFFVRAISERKKEIFSLYSFAAPSLFSMLSRFSKSSSCSAESLASAEEISRKMRSYSACASADSFSRKPICSLMASIFRLILFFSPATLSNLDM